MHNKSSIYQLLIIRGLLIGLLYNSCVHKPIQPLPIIPIDTNTQDTVITDTTQTQPPDTMVQDTIMPCDPDTIYFERDLLRDKDNR